MGILEARNLRAGYGRGDIIRDIDLNVAKGEFVCVLGPNGSGKSTLVKALQGLLKDVSGEVRIDGVDLSRLTRREMARRIAFVPQVADLTFEFSVLEVVAMGRYARQGRMAGSSEADRRIIRSVLDMVEVSHLREERVAHLSGGERQRVLIARALAQDTPLLCLDEPSSHLDLNYGLEVFEILERLQKEEKKTIFATEHNINLVIPYAHQIIFLKDGKIFAQGEPAGMITQNHIKEVFGADVDIRENRYSKLPEVSLIPRISDRRRAAE